MAKEDRGFASMDRSRQREIASKGGKAAHQKRTAHEWTSDEAREAGRKGGIASHRRKQEQMGGDTAGHASGSDNGGGETAEGDTGEDPGAVLLPETSRFPRLSHAQWENTVQDLFELPEATGLSSLFIGDPISGGFDNNSEALKVASVLWTDYQRAAE